MVLPQNHKGMLIDGVAASEAIDSSGETLSLKGLDISDFENGVGCLNFEHKTDKDPGASANDIIGRIVYAKKIYKRENCENDRQRKYWDKIETPYLYIVAELFDAEGHPGAVAAAALIRHYHARKLPILMRYSIEGSTLEKKGNEIIRSVARKVAATIKPCNRSCYSGVVSDPKESPQESKEVTEILMGKFEPPDAQRLSTVETEVYPYETNPVELLKFQFDRLKEVNQLHKALTASSYDVAPSSLAGGAALSRENVGRKKFLKNQVLAAVRDWDGYGRFRDFLKHRLPEVDDSYIDYFANMVEDYRITKAQELHSDLGKATGLVHSDIRKDEPPITPAVADVPIRALEEPETHGFQGPLTIGGKARRPISSIQKMAHSKFDEKAGVLYTPLGSVPVYNPANDLKNYNGSSGASLFMQAMTDPKIQDYHKRAMHNWMQLHDLLRRGATPEVLPAYAAHFAIFSGNNPVPVQELMYGHLQDVLKEYQIDALHPDLAALHDAFQKRSGQIPQFSEDYFTGPALEGITTSGGYIEPHARGGQLFHYVSQYHKDHPILVGAMQKWRHDGRNAVKDIQDQKTQGGLLGLKRKTTRYAYSMLGAGNTIVPDTHFIRHLFGLDHENDIPTIDYLKDILWKRGDIGLLDKIDRWYHNNHPAVKYVQQKYFDGRPTEDAIFPAFWLHWMAIRPHEKAIGRKVNDGGSNQSDHTVFWNSVGDVLAHHGLPFSLAKSEFTPDKITNTPVHVRAALAAQELFNRFGGGAWMPYFAEIVPVLMDHAKVHKMEILTNDLKKAMDDKPAAPQNISPKVWNFKGQKIQPGEVKLLDGSGNPIASMPYLGQDDSHIFVVDAGKTKKIHRSYEDVGYSIMAPPQPLKGRLVLNHAEHGNDSANYTKEHQALIHGLDLEQLNNGWGKSAAGHVVFVKPALDHNTLGIWADDIAPGLKELSTARREAIFHNLAREVFNLGAHTPPTAVFKHPETGQEHVAKLFAPGGRHAELTRVGGHRQLNPNDEGTDQLKMLGHAGTLDKLALMDYVLGVGDRSDTQYTMHPNTNHGISLIGNGLAFAPHEGSIPKYLFRYHQLLDPGIHPDELRHQAFHPEAVVWLKNIDPKFLAEHMARQGVPADLIQSSVRKLMLAQRKVADGGTKGQVLLEPEGY